ncbi:MAG: alginate lyase family protein [Tagaea sp.]
MTLDRRVFLAGIAALPACAQAPALRAGDFVNPFDAAAMRARKGRPAPANAACEAAPAPARDLIVPQFYTDPPVYSRVDPERLAARDAAVLPLQTLSRTVAQSVDRWASSAPVQGRFAACAVTSLDAAARAGSLLGRVDNQGGYERKWVWCGLALSHLKLVQAPEYGPDAQARVREWFAAGFEALRAYYDRPPAGSPSDRLNNHMTWAGLTAMAIGLAAEDRRAWEWGLSRMERTLAQIDADGFLPLELMRGSKAWHYHIFAVAPLAMGAILARPNGIDLADARFHRLARRTFEAYADPAAFVARTGVAQETWGTRPDVGWLELYAGEFGAVEALPLLRGRRPQIHPWLGGDLTFWHARDA